MEDLFASYKNDDESEEENSEVFGPQIEEPVTKKQKIELPADFKKAGRYISKKERKEIEENNVVSLVWKVDEFPLLQIPKCLNEIENKKLLPTDSMSFQEHHKVVQCIRWSKPNGHLLASGSLDSTVKLYDIFERKKCILSLQGQAGGVRDIQWSNDGKQLITCGYDPKVLLFDVETGKYTQNFVHKEYVTSLCYHPNQSNIFLTGGFTTGIACWDVRSNKCISQFSGHFGQVQSIEFINDGKYFVSSADVVKRNSIDKGIIVWDFDSGSIVSNQVYLEAFSCSCIKVHPDGKHFVAQSSGNYIAIFSTNHPFKLNKHKRFEGHIVSANHIQCSFSPCGSLLATGSANGCVYYYNWEATKPVHVVKLHEKACMDVEFHPRIERIIASCGWDGKVTITSTSFFSNEQKNKRK